jgi:hypothetical protein
MLKHLDIRKYKLRSDMHIHNPFPACISMTNPAPCHALLRNSRVAGMFKSGTSGLQPGATSRRNFLTPTPSQSGCLCAFQSREQPHKEAPTFCGWPRVGQLLCRDMHRPRIRPTGGTLRLPAYMQHTRLCFRCRRPSLVSVPSDTRSSPRRSDGTATTVRGDEVWHCRAALRQAWYPFTGPFKI